MQDQLTFQYSIPWIWLPTGDPGDWILHHSCGSQMWPSTRKGKVVSNIIVTVARDSEKAETCSMDPRRPVRRNLQVSPDSELTLKATSKPHLPLSHFLSPYPEIFFFFLKFCIKNTCFFKKPKHTEVMKEKNEHNPFFCLFLLVRGYPLWTISHFLF